MNKELIQKSYEIAKLQYAEIGIDTDLVLNRMRDIAISLHCWQTDDVGGFETPDATLSGGGIQATGNYPGKATTIGQMRQDLEKVLTLLPGKQRLNLHAINGDFNASCFSHPKSSAITTSTASTLASISSTPPSTASEPTWWAPVPRRKPF